MQQIIIKAKLLAIIPILLPLYIFFAYCHHHMFILWLYCLSFIWLNSQLLVILFCNYLLIYWYQLKPPQVFLAQHIYPNDQIISTFLKIFFLKTIKFLLCLHPCKLKFIVIIHVYIHVIDFVGAFIANCNSFTDL